MQIEPILRIAGLLQMKLVHSFFIKKKKEREKQEGRKESAGEEDHRCKRETQTMYSQSQSLEWKQTLNSPCAQASLFGI